MGSPVDTGQAFYVLPSLTVHFVEASGEPLRELYVLYRVAPPPKQPENDSLMSYFGKLVMGEAQAPPPPRFELGVTDKQGYLTPLGGVEGIKLVNNIPYEMYLLRHPDPS